MSSSVVSAPKLETLLDDLGRSISQPQHGVFGPGSLNWKVNRESALFLAAGRAALLQLAHPWVAAAIAQHSRTLHDPIGRFHQTFRVMFTMSFCPMEAAFAAARRLYRLHETIRGSLPDSVGVFARGSTYEANEVGALTWVFATLIDSSVLAYEFAQPPLSEAEREQYFAENRRSAALFGIPPEQLPQNWAAFETYMQSMLSSDTLGVSPATQQLAHRLQQGTGLRIKPPFWYQALTVHLLPPRFRQEFGFEYGQRERASAVRSLVRIRRIYPYLPAAFRFVGPYREAVSRINGRNRPGLAVRLSNRLWIGQPRLCKSDSE